MDNDLAFMTALELRRLIATKEVSPVELTRMYLDRIERLDPRLNSYLTVTADQAMDSARDAEKAVTSGEELGPLHGVPVSIKDSDNTKGVRTTQGSLVYKDFVPHTDSIVVERTKRAGAVILGKTNLPENGDLGTTENRLGDHCRNPWDTSRTSGGSSGGAGAALAAGLCSLASGGDGGGSIRIPASFCGVYGIKPTLGRVPLYSGPGAPVTTNVFSQPGPMSRTVRDSAMFLQVLAGHDPRHPPSLRQEPADYLAATDKSVSGLSIGWSPDFGYAAVEPRVVETCARAARVFEDMGCFVEESDLALDSPFDAFWTLYTTVSYARSGRMLEDHTDELTWYGREVLENGARTTGAETFSALGGLDVVKAQFAEQLQRYDLLLSPTMATSAFNVGEHPKEIAGREVHPFWGFLPFTFPVNMAGLPAASVPCGFDADGLPIGLHIIGQMGDEATVLAASAAFEEARPWADRRPPVS